MQMSVSVVVVTGAAGNLGNAVVRSFYEAGARLVLADLSRQQLEDRFPDLVGDDRCLPVSVDLTRESSVTEMIERARERFGTVHVLANIAGGFRMGPRVHETPADDWAFMMDLNARSVFLAVRAVLPLMLAQGGGKIVSIAARAGLTPKANMVPYCVSKSAVISLTEGLSAEYKADGININCILPGTIDTPENRSAMPDADHARWVSPAALADVVMFLSSDAASAIHGAAVPVYGES